MITFAEFKTAVQSRLDAGSNSNYYNDGLNYIPAFNSAVNWITSVISRALDENKITSEALSELRSARVYQTSAFSRIYMEDYWFIESVNPLPMVSPAITINGSLPPQESELREDLVHLYSNYECKRLTKEEWEVNANNPFSPGNIVTKCGSLTHGSSNNIKFAYLSPIVYDSAIGPELEVRPYLNRKLCTVFVIETPQQISNSNGSVKFHIKLLPLLVEKGLFYMSYEQGDGPSIMEMSEKEVTTVAQILTI